MKLLERFESQINKIVGGCWLWTGELSPSGYGILRMGGSSLPTHRISFEIYKDQIPQGLCVCHACDVRACVNPDHLWLGTQTENIEDATKKGRMNRGEDNARSKLTEDKVKDIIALYKTGDYSQAELGAQFGVNHSIISDIITGKKWKYIEIDRSFRRGRGSVGNKNGSRLHPEKLKRGEEHKGTKISDTIVAEIRDISEQYTHKKLAEIFGISKTQIGRILRNESRKKS